MDPKIRNIFLLLFLIAFIGTFVVYFTTDKNMRLTWYFGGAAILFYLIYRFSAKRESRRSSSNKFRRR